VRALASHAHGWAAWVGAAIAVAVLLLLRAELPWLQAPPQAMHLPLAELVGACVDAVAQTLKPLFQAIAHLLDYPILWLRSFLLWIPWPAVVLLLALAGWAAAGWRIAAFNIVGILYIVAVGLWPKAAVTLSLVGVAVPLAVLSGLVTGILMQRYRPVRHAIEPLLDFMQTVPTFAYLIPMLAFFGLGPVVGVLASVVYAIPPMARNVCVAIERVPTPIIEAGRMSGATGSQVLFHILLPTAMPGILLGVNQTIMAVLSMAVISSILGGSPDIGWEIILTMKRAQFGDSIVAGLVLALIAMMLDRTSAGFAESKGMPSRATKAVWVAAILAILVILFIPSDYYPSYRLNIAPSLDAAVTWFTANFYPVTDAIKNAALIYVLLPLKIGLVGSVRAATWGFDLTPLSTSILVAGFACLAIIAGAWKGWRYGVAVAVMSLIYFHGLTGLPWIAIIVLAVLIAFQTGGPRVAAVMFIALLLPATSGLWESSMVTLQICAAGVIVAFILGTTTGIGAALSDTFSAAIRPVWDTFQTMPIFVFLIPAIMVFLVGEFTALVAIVLYAIVPAARYTEHGLRSIPQSIVEASTSMGTTRIQRLMTVELPLALPEILLGLNQTVMMAVSMVIVAALAGARGLGQDIMVALTWLDAGKGLLAGFCVALLAIAVDRVIQAWATSIRTSLGLESAT